MANEHISPLKRWRLIGKVSRDIWKSWSNDYLAHLQQRIKWKVPHRNIKEGSLVIVKEENTPPGKWLLGRIIETHPGPDGKIRVVSVKCRGDTVLQRSITKICPLILEEEQESQLSLSKKDTIIQQTFCITKRDYVIKEQQPRKRKSETIIDQEARPSVTHKKLRIYPVSGYNCLIPVHHPQKYEKYHSNGRFQPNPSKRGRPEHQAYPEEDAGIKRRLTYSQYKERRQNQMSTWITCLILLFIIKLGNCTFSIINPKPGMYIEHVGETRIRRGTLRVEVHYPVNTTMDMACLNNTVSQMEKLCRKTQAHSGDVHCKLLLHHLQDKQHSLLRDIEIFQGRQQERKRRGILGQLLQSVFGVNDEVYHNIDELKKNQQALIQASQQQTNIMLSTIAQVKNSENTTQHRMVALNEKLNKAIAEINKVEEWFSSVDKNRVNVHILSAYQIAMNILDELALRYTTFIQIRVHRGNLLDILTPGELAHLIYTASEKIPPSLNILQQPEDSIDLNLNNTHLSIFGYFHITDATTYEVVKITPIPKKVTTGIFSIPDIPRTILAADYNSQTYFELSDEEWEQCVRLETHSFLCSPTVISRIESNPNCVIDELYQRHEKQPCTFQEIRIAHTLFKHLYKVSSWLFVADTPTAAAVICNGIHEDAFLNGTGIINIGQGCILKTTRNILNSGMTGKISIKKTFIKSLDFNVSQATPTRVPEHSRLKLEPVLKASDHFDTLEEKANLLHKQLSSIAWMSIAYPT